MSRVNSCSSYLVERNFWYCRCLIFLAFFLCSCCSSSLFVCVFECSIHSTINEMHVMWITWVRCPSRTNQAAKKTSLTKVLFSFPLANLSRIGIENQSQLLNRASRCLVRTEVTGLLTSIFEMKVFYLVTPSVPPPSSYRPKPKTIQFKQQNVQEPDK